MKATGVYAIRHRRSIALAVAALVVLSGLVPTIFVVRTGAAASTPVGVAAGSLTPRTGGGSGGPIQVAPAFRPTATIDALGPLPPATPMEVDVGLALTNAPGFQALLASQYVPGSPMFHQWINASRFAALYGPSPDSVSRATAYFSEEGLSVSLSPDHLLLRVSGPASQMATAFGTSFVEYRGPGGGVFFSHPTPAALPDIAPWSGVLGLGNSTPLVPLAVPFDARTAIAGPAASCVGTTEYLVPCQMWTAYNMSGLVTSGTDGAGYRIGIEDTYDGQESQDQLSSDLGTFDSDMGLPGATVVYNYPIPTSLDLNATANVWGLEEALDLEWNHAAAPGATIEMTFSPDSGPGLYAGIDWLVSGERVDVISLSWGENDVGLYNAFDTPCATACNATTDGSYAVLSPVLALAAAEGISVFSASGDCGAADGTSGVATNYPASDVSVTGVGGTVLSVNASGDYLSETAWSGNESGASSPGCQNRGGSGGGFSPLPRPWWQAGPGVPATPDRRGVPDVALDAGTPVEMVIGGSTTLVGGTSLGTPMWAGIAAIADQYHGGDLGLLNPSLYRILSGSSYSVDFHDITSGNNGYAATTDWDPVTGIGTPIVSALVPALSRTVLSQSSLRTFLYSNLESGPAPLTVSFGITAMGGSGEYPVEGVYFGDGNSSLSANGSAVHTYPSPGVYAALSFVVDSTGNLTISEPLDIVVGGHSSLTVHLSANNPTPTAGAPVVLTATASGGTAPYEYDWSFGDGSYLNWTPDASLSHTYVQSGDYCPVVIARDSANPIDGGTSGPLAIAVGGGTPANCTQVLGPLEATPDGSAGIRDAPADYPSLFNFSGGPSQWDPSSIATAYNSTGGPADPYVAACDCLIIRSPGSYQIHVTASDPEGQQAQSVANVTVAPPLLGSFTASVTHGAAPLAVSFSAQASGGYGANASLTEWTFGDGTFAEGSSASHTYGTPGLYLAIGHLSDLGHGNASEAFLIDVISGEVPSVSATIAPAIDVAEGATVTLSAAAYGANGLPTAPAAFLWNLGNGSSAYGASANFTYEGPNATGSVGWNGSLSVTEVPGLPLSQIPLGLVPFGAAEAGGFMPRVDALRSGATGGPARDSAPFTWHGVATATGPGGPAFEWSATGGNTSDQSTAQFVFSVPGTDNVVLTTTDPYGDVAYLPHSVTVYSPLTFSGGPSTLGGSAPLAVNFTIIGRGGTGAPYAFRWVLGNLTERTTENTSYTFGTPGRFFIELVLADSIGTEAFGNWTILVTSAGSSSNATIGGVPYGAVLLAVAAAIGVAAAIIAVGRRRRPPPPVPSGPPPTP